MTSKRIIIVPIEPLETRYTAEWYSWLPKVLTERGLEVEVIDGTPLSNAVTSGAFLNFTSTNFYKASQLLAITSNLQKGLFKIGDTFLFTDAWNPSVINLRYMIDLLELPVTLVGMWHAGSYDPNDFLGKAMDKQWSFPFERALYNAYDKNYFATNYHWNLFKDTILESAVWEDNKHHIVGWPMEYLKTTIGSRRKSVKKENIVVFPHRISNEKNPELFKQLSLYVGSLRPDIKFIMCQEQQLSKQQYHDILLRSKVVFSASLQETLGIGVYEGMLAGCLPFIPDRLSYSEIFQDSPFKPYPSTHACSDKKIYLASKLISMIDTYAEHASALDDLSMFDKYFEGSALYENLLD